MADRLFGKNIDPACEYCSHGKLTTDGSTVLCRKRGIMQKYQKCRRFDYDPLLREPRTPPPLPEFSEEDFEI